MKKRPHCFLRPILRPAAVFALAFGVTSLMLSAQDDDAALDADEVVTEAAEEADASEEPAAETEAAEADGAAEEEAAEEEPVLSGEEQELTAEAEADLIENEKLFGRCVLTVCNGKAVYSNKINNNI